MNETKNIYRQVQRMYSVFVLVAVIAFVGMTILKLKPILHGGIENVVLERYAIMITLICIPLSLKIYHDLIQKTKDKLADAKERYFKNVSLLRLCILELSLFFNVWALSQTGRRSFFYMIFITLVAFLFCRPNKTEFETLCKENNNVSND